MGVGTTRDGLYARATAMAAAAGAALTVGGVAVSLVIGSRPRSGLWQTVDQVLLWDLLMGSALVIALLVARRQPHNRIGWWLAGGGLLGAYASFADQWGAWALEADPGVAPGGTIAVLTSSVGFYASWAILAAQLPIRFPTGELLSRRWRWVSRLATASALLCGIEIFHPRAFEDSSNFLDLEGVTNPIGIPGFGPIAELAFGVGILALFLATFAGVASLVVRYRRSTGVEREQVRWVAFTASVGTIAGLAMANLASAVHDPLRGVLLGAGNLLPIVIFAGVGIAVLRHQLFDIDVIIRRTLLVGLLGAFIAAVYAAVIVLGGWLFGTSGLDNPWLSVIAATAIALSLQPVRSRLERLANRFVYGDVISPYDLVSSLGVRLTNAVSPGETLSELAAVAARGLRGDGARVRLHLDGGDQEAWWTAGADALDAARLTIVRPVDYGGSRVGEIAIAPRPDDPPSAADLRMLHDLANHASVALHNLRLGAELQERLEELRASRERLVGAQTEERRRMERDIHDGAQQQLVALSIKLGLLRSLVAPDGDAPAAEALAEELQLEAREALETLRDLARGLFPPTLAERGLGPAVRAHVEKAGLPASVEEVGLEGVRFDLNAEAAVYFCIREALQNASKHAPGKPVAIRLEHEGDRLTFSVADEGPGFDPAQVVRGAGLTNMVDRIEALGGRLRFDRRPEGGTVVRGDISLPSAAEPAPRVLSTHR